jgi:hypothetical protein
LDGLGILGMDKREESVYRGMSNLYSDPARWWCVCDDVKDKIADILLAIVSTIDKRSEETARYVDANGISTLDDLGM